MSALMPIVALLLQTAASEPAVGARNPAYARDGRLAVSVQGDLWVVSKSGQWTRVTSGPAWDREPAWTPDGSAIVFSSDRAGNFDLWRVAVASSGTAGEPERLTTSPLAEGEPASRKTDASSSCAVDSVPRRCGFTRRTGPNRA